MGSCSSKRATAWRRPSRYSRRRRMRAWGYRQSASTVELASTFFGRLGEAVRHRLDDSAVTDQVAQQLVLPPMDLSAVDMELVRSPARRSQLRAQISTGSAV